MSEAVAFLHALAQALSTMALYSPGHPAAKRAVENLWHAVNALLAADAHPVFLFLGTAPVYNGRALQELRDWNHSPRLAAAGVQRIEFGADVTVDALTALVDRLMARLAGDAPAAGEAPLHGVAFGPVAVEGADADPVVADSQDAEPEMQEVQLDLGDEVSAMIHILAEAAAGRVARAETDALGRVLGGLVEQLYLPQVAYSGEADRMLAEETINIALLAMASAALIGIDAAGRHRVAVAALLHDVGIARGRAQPAPERDHPRAGASFLLTSGVAGLELAAVVAHEHHWQPDGGGYPVLRAEPHRVSRLIGAAGAFIRSRSPSTAQRMSVDAALAYLADGAGTAFDAVSVAAISRAVRPA
jgi:hypothetical protein